MKAHQRWYRLIVIFSAFSTKGKPPRYNYIETLKGINATQLYILDSTGYNKAGSYYLGEDDHFYVPEQICRLISQIKQKYHKSRVITCGSSKGGTSAIYYGLKLSATAVICGAPQYRIGTYLRTDEHMPILEGIIGNASEEKITALDSLLKKEIIKHATDKHRPIICMHYSPEEHTYNEHIAKLIADFKSNGYPIVLDNNYTYKNHSDVGKYFKAYLWGTLDSIVNKGEPLNSFQN